MLIVAMVKNSKTEYYVHGKSVYWNFDFQYNNHTWSVCRDGDGYFEVYLEEYLKPYEETYQYKENLKNLEEIKSITSQRKELVESIQKEAFKKLQSRMRLNMAFSEEDKLTTVGVLIATELGKIIKDMEVKPTKDDKQK